MNWDHQIHFSSGMNRMQIRTAEMEEWNLTNGNSWVTFRMFAAYLRGYNNRPYFMLVLSYGAQLSWQGPVGFWRKDKGKFATTNSSFYISKTQWGLMGNILNIFTQTVAMSSLRVGTVGLLSYEVLLRTRKAPLNWASWYFWWSYSSNAESRTEYSCKPDRCMGKLGSPHILSFDCFQDKQCKILTCLAPNFCIVHPLDYKMHSGTLQMTSL